MINLGGKEVLDIKLGSTNITSVYKGEELIWPNRQPKILIYTTTSENQNIQLVYNKEYFVYIETEDGVEDISGSGSLSHTFTNPGEHEVKVLFRRGITNIRSCFNGCSELTTIPSNLFEDNPEITSFGYCFANCDSLTTIPEGLFDNNPEATGFNNCFDYCEVLTTIPSNLFIKNIKVTSFYYCFNQCRSLTSSVPIDDDGTPIYERSGLKSGYTQVTRFANCFSGCSKMPDYDSIPSDWK